MSEPWMFEMSKHSMRRGSTSRSSSVAQRRAGSPATACAGGATPGRRRARVAHHQLQQAHLLARAGGRGCARALPRRCGEPRLQQLAVGQLRRDQHLPRDVAPVRVVLLDGGGQEPLRLRHACPAGSPRARPPCRRAPRRPAARPGRHSTWAPKRSRSSRSVVVIFCGVSSRSRVRIWSRRLAASSKRSSAAASSICALQAAHHLVRAPLQEQPRVLGGLAVALQASRSRPRTAPGSA